MYVNFVLLAIHDKLECYYSHLTTKKANYYRPQRSYGDVIFSQASVSHSVHRGGCLADTLPRQTTHRQTPPADIHPDRHPQADTHRRHPPGRHTPPADTPPPGRHTPPGRRLLLRTVRILLECILVYCCCYSVKENHLNLSSSNVNALLAIVDLSVVQSSAQTFIHNSILFYFVH